MTGGNGAEGDGGGATRKLSVLGGGSKPLDNPELGPVKRGGLSSSPYSSSSSSPIPSTTGCGPSNSVTSPSGPDVASTGASVKSSSK